MCDLCVRSLWYEFTTSPWGHSVVTVWCHRNMRWLHHSEVTVLSQCDVTDARDGHFTMMSQCCHIMMFTMWGNYDVSMISELWHHMCDLFVRSLWYEFSTSTWGHSVITVWCHRYTRWPHHHEVTVLSQDDAHHVRSLRYQNYDITSVMFLWGHSDTNWAHHIEVTLLSQYDVTGTQGDHITMRSQCCHMTMLTWWGHYDILMISKLWHHMCEMVVRSQ